MSAPELSLANVSSKIKVREHRVSDYLTEEEKSEVRNANAKGKNKRFDQIDAYIAEIIARFGYQTYEAWKSGTIDEQTMVRLIEAERTREARDRLRLENVLVAAIAGANRPTKHGHAPKSLKVALKMLKSEQKLAEGSK